ncbi:helitron helicase-like domain-containing protein [Artemisia annua]|uniref:Helitron helicase-like domain-containing protein n=1 Tax=Artemisia annua TaxID=35608 RepID=A0A2U1NIV8_ARTAN|nr:helitron helicase-like domain-containing protein [Artemisia annua]
MNQKTIPFPEKKPSYRLSNPTNTHTSPQCKIHSPNVANVVTSDSHDHQPFAASNTNDHYVRQESVHDASHMQCPPSSVTTPSAQQCSPATLLQDTFTNGRQKNGRRLLQATGSSQHDNRCLQQSKKRAISRKDKGTTEPVEVRQESVHDAIHMQCPPPSVTTPSAQQCTPAALLQDTFTNGRRKNGRRLLQATGSSQHDNRCLQQPKKRARSRKDKGTTEPAEGSSTSDATCLQHPRKRGRPRKEKVAEESGNCDLPGGMCPVVGSSQQRQECVHPTNNIITPNVQSHNSHSQPQTDNQQLSLSQRKETQKRNRDLQQFSTRRIRQRSSEPHVHATGEPQTTEAEATCVRTDALPDDPQTAAYTNRRSRRTRRQRILMQHFQSSLHSPANAREEGSSSCTQQVRQGSVHDASHMQCPPPSVNTPSAQQCTPVAFLQDTLTNGGLKNGGRLLQATVGSSQHDNRCLQQPKKRGRPRKDKGTTEPVEEATCVRTDALPDDPQTAAYTNRRSRRTRRQRILMQHFQSSLHSPANAREEGSSSCTQQDFNGPELDPEIVQGLIHFLDEHNELVQLLRTARDKCAQHDVPEFKLRLYSGERPRGYELPGSHIIGAIVFDSGPESESNYDVIIEYRGGVIKRVSKIHKSYMSLQFPLIFIYGQPGYHTKLMLRTADPNDEPKRPSSQR